MIGRIIGFCFCLGLIAFVYWYSQKNQKETRKKNEPITVQDLLSYKELSNDGFMELENGTFTVLLELQQTNTRLKNITEKNSIWLKFRQLVNSVGVHQTLLIQSQFLDMNDYIHDYEQESDAHLDGMTDELIEMRKCVLNHFKGFSEKKQRDYRSYVIFRLNPYKNGSEKGVTTGNVSIDRLLQSVKGVANTMTEEEAKEYAKSMLDEVSDLSYQLYDSMGIKAMRLNRVGVLNMCYLTLNRDLNLAQKLVNVNNSHSFTEFKQSLTPMVSTNGIDLNELDEMDGELDKLEQELLNSTK